jgi:ADP-ribosylglycohydrolase
MELYMNGFSDKLKGTVYGQAIGDALGLGTEGMTDEDMAWKYPNGIQHYSDIFQDRHRKRWKIGDWTDDTDMMLCIANAVIKDKGVNYTTIAHNFKDWADGEPMGIGETTYKVLSFGDYIENPFKASKMLWDMSHQQSAANGGVMRTSIVGLFPIEVEEFAANICRLTHYDPRCAGSCAIVSLLIHALVFEEENLSYHQIVEIGQKYDSRIREYIDLSMNTDIRALELQDWDSVGYTLKTLAAGLWAYWNAKSFEEGLLSVVRAGGDADTNAAVACAILGAKYGFNAIPQEYVDGLIYKEQLDRVVSGMIEFVK